MNSERKRLETISPRESWSALIMRDSENAAAHLYTSGTSVLGERESKLTRRGMIALKYSCKPKHVRSGGLCQT